MSISEEPILFSCAGEQLLGIIARPESAARTGVLIVVGGPQYRAGSHRQFLLLSRGLAAAGYPAMRFDYRGMGDNCGEQRNFESVSDDIRAAIDAFQTNLPGFDRFVLWGLCDAASASLLYWDATHDPRIVGLVLLNPWVRSEATLARAHIKHYYGQRLLQPAFWRKLLTGQLGIVRAIGGFLGSLQQAGQARAEHMIGLELSFRQRMLRALDGFQGNVLLILSGNDYTAKEFVESSNACTEWQVALEHKKVRRVDVAGADHTFSSGEWCAAVERLTLDWLRQGTGN